MRRLVAACALACAMGATQAQAAMLVWSAEFEFSGSGGTLAHGAASIQLTLEDIVGSGVQFTLVANLAPGEYLSGLYLNYSPDTSLPTNANFTSEAGTLPSSISLGADAFKADGDGYFDIFLEFPTAGSSRFDGTDTLTYLITGSTVASLTAISENGPAGKTGFPVAFRAQGLAGGNSGFFSDRIVPSVPEPTSMLLLGAGLIGLGTSVRRRRRQGHWPPRTKRP